MAGEPTGTGYWLLDTIRNWWRRPPPPDPWDAETEAAVNQEDAVPICHHCTEPQAPGTWFCPQCGTAVGAYNNSMPYLRIFSIGEVLRSGLAPHAQFTLLTIPGYILVALTQYGVLPLIVSRLKLKGPGYFLALLIQFGLVWLYLFRVFRNMRRQEELPPDPSETNDETIP